MIFRGFLWSLFALFAWFGGLVWFIETMPQVPPRNAEKTDAIVVLTGGNGRIAKGFDLLNKGFAPRLLISGVTPGLTVKDLVRASGYKGDVDERRVAIDPRARSTIQNARETARWLGDLNLGSIRLVTANYHMKRALHELDQRVGTTKIIPHWVVALDPLKKSWCKDHKVFCLYMNEYHKYIGSRLRGLLRLVYFSM